MIQNPYRDKLKEFESGGKDLAKLYQSVFLGSPEGQIVLEDLRVYGFFYDTTAGEFYKENEGRRQINLYINKALEMDTSPEPQPTGEENEPSGD
jgi:hypothetical protein